MEQSRTEKPAPQPSAPPPAPEMPPLYFERTTAGERARHQEKLARLARQGGMLIEAIGRPDGGCDFEIVTMDWEEPGLLDRIFEAVLRCHRLEHGLSIRHARVFTSARGEVVNILELRDRGGGPLSAESRQTVLQRLGEIRPGERGALETIQNFPYRSLIPLVEDLPVFDNEISDRFTCIRIAAERISNRFTSVLLHFLARSELWLNIQVAEMEQGEKGQYQFYVVDKHGQKLRDSNFLRHSLVGMLEAMNGLVTRFNLYYLQREWQHRLEKNHYTIYHSRPDFDDFLKDIENIRQLSTMKGLGREMSGLVEAGLLESQSLYFLKKVEAFVNRHMERNRAMRESAPGEGDVELCREYFQYRREAMRILNPLFQRMVEMPMVNPLLSPSRRLEVLCRPFPFAGYALDEQERLTLDGQVWLGEPSAALDPFLLMARTNCAMRGDLLAAVEASVEGWNEFYIGENREELGSRFLAIVDESIRQGNTASVMRMLRSVGLLERYIPGFEQIQGRIHINADHEYTVDEHSMAVIDVVEGLMVLNEVLPKPGPSAMRSDYEQIADAQGLKNYARKYAMELRMLSRISPLRHHETLRPFFHVMKDVQRNSLEYLIEVNLLEFGYDTCMAALTELEGQRRLLDAMIGYYLSLPFGEKRILVLAGLLHDIRKPAVDHGALGADALSEILAGMGLKLAPEAVTRLEWLIRHHLDVRPLISRMGADGEQALADFTAQAGDPSLVKSLILFTYADRVAMRTDHNANNHDAMVLSEMLAMVDRPPGL